MGRMKAFVAVLLVTALAGFGMVFPAGAQAQGAYGTSDRQVRQLLRRIENRTDRFRGSLDGALDRSEFNGTERENQLNTVAGNLKSDAAQLRERFNRRQSTAQDVEAVLSRAAILNTFMENNRLEARAERDWVLLRDDLNQLARSYNVAWRWDAPGVNPSGAQLAYTVSDSQMRQLIGRIETRSDRFSKSLESALDRSALNGTSREDEINKMVTDFEFSTDQLEKRFESRQSTDTDVQLVLQRASLLNTVMEQNRFDYGAVSDWRALKADLDNLAGAYGVAWNWDTITTPGAGGYAAGNMIWTGTYRLDTARSQDPRAVAVGLTRSLPYGQRQRIHDELLALLESPDMLAVERRGESVTLASTRSPQSTFVADGVEQVEQYPGGGLSRLRAVFNGNQLIITSAGSAGRDFTVTFDPLDQNTLRVTRRVSYASAYQPVTVESYYHRVAEAAQWNVYGTSQGAYTGPYPGAAGGFIVPHGTAMVAVLNDNLTTDRSREGDRFTLTVREPAQYSGAVIEGYVSNVSPSGRITGRSGMTLNFERIRLATGQTYDFAGIIEGAQTARGEVVRVDNEGAVSENDSRTGRTVQRTAIGSAVGAIIGAIAGGGRGAAIGAAAGAGAGAGSVYIQGRDHLELTSGSQLMIRASAPR